MGLAGVLTELSSIPCADVVDATSIKNVHMETAFLYMDMITHYCYEDIHITVIFSVAADL